MKFKLIFFFLFYCLVTNAQTGNSLLWDDFRQQLLANNPLVRQANLFNNQAEAALLRARGGFDVKLFADHNAKNFNGTNYFEYTEAGAKWPTWLGVELKGQYNWLAGRYYNPEYRIPDLGQASFGLTWTLGQGLLFDERRAGLRAAQIGIRQAKAERDAYINDLLLDAAKQYWSWVAAVNQLSVFEEALRQARLRHEGTRETFLLGDRPGIDTVETFIQVQTREMDVFLSRLEVQNFGLELGNLLWTDDQIPLEPTAIPGAPVLNLPTAAPPVFDQMLQQALTSHPTLRFYQTKLDELDVERRLKLEKRKPVVDLNYNILGSGWNFFPTTTENGLPAVLANDIKWGITFSYPILNRKARGDYQVTALKIVQTDFQLRQKRLEIENKVRQYTNELNNMTVQLNLAREQLARYRTLLDAEIDRFNFGESSIFLINTREQRWLDAQVKYQKLLAEYKKTLSGLYWAAGLLENAPIAN